MTKLEEFDIIDKHSSRGQKTKDPTDGESSGFQEPMELQAQHNIRQFSSKKDLEKIQKKF